MVVFGAGATYDSVPTRPVEFGKVHPSRPPLADALFEPRPLFQKWQRLFPAVMQVSTALGLRRNGESVEDVMHRLLEQAPQYPDRNTQLAAVRFYIQAIIAETEAEWYESEPIATNHMALVDQIEAARAGRTPPIYVTFNYDRLVEDALTNRGRHFDSLDDYIPAGDSAVVKLHGSVDWVRNFEMQLPGKIGGDAYEIARGICRNISALPRNAPIQKMFGLPPVNTRESLSMPAIAIPVKQKATFECPPSHLERLIFDLGRVRTILTIGWRGAEEHFLKLLGQHALQNLDVICVAGDNADAEQSVRNLSTVLERARFEAVGGGFTNFVRDERISGLLDLTWRKH